MKYINGKFGLYDKCEELTGLKINLYWSRKSDIKKEIYKKMKKIKIC